MVSIDSHVDDDGEGDMFHQMVNLYSQRARGRRAGGSADRLYELRAALVLHRGCRPVLCSICC
jgi:hypothetical protein